jgi:cell division protein FtsL
LRDSEPSQEEKRIERSIARATTALEKVRTAEKVFNFAISITATVARFAAIYAKMQA